MTTPASVLFLAHGSPLFALDPGAAGAALAELATGLERPRAVLVISPHWETAWTMVPVVPLSIQHHGGPEHAYRVGQALAPLVEQGWLIVASGNITHNLRDWQQARLGGGVDTRYVQHFSDWVAEQLSAGQVEALLPLFTALGAAGPEARAQPIHRGISDHVHAMDCQVDIVFLHSSGRPAQQAVTDRLGQTPMA